MSTVRRSNGTILGFLVICLGCSGGAAGRAAWFGVEVEGIPAVEVVVVVMCRREVGGVLLVDVVPFRAESVERVREIGCGPRYAGIDDRCEARCLIDLVVEVSPSNLTQVGEEQVAAQRVQALTHVQLAPHPAMEFLVGDVMADVDRADQPPVFAQRPGQSGLSTADVQLGDEQAGCRVPELHRAHQAEHVVPVLDRYAPEHHRHAASVDLHRPGDPWRQRDGRQDLGVLVPSPVGRRPRAGLAGPVTERPTSVDRWWHDGPPAAADPMITKHPGSFGCSADPG